MICFVKQPFAVSVVSQSGFETESRAPRRLAYSGKILWIINCKRPPYTVDNDYKR